MWLLINYVRVVVTSNLIALVGFVEFRDRIRHGVILLPHEDGNGLIMAEIIIPVRELIDKSFHALGRLNYSNSISCLVKIAVKTEIFIEYFKSV